MLGKPRILSLFPNSVINSIKHEHSCKILYVITSRVENSMDSDQLAFQIRVYLGSAW